MKLSYLYKKAIEFGSKIDPRGKTIKAYEDTAILYGSPDVEVNKMLVGIDIDSSEILLADRLRSDHGLDLVLGHHPAGRASAIFYEVMDLQVDVLVKFGLSRQVIKQFMQERKRDIERWGSARNHSRVVDTARLLDMPFMCVHTPADNHVAYFLQKLFDTKKPARVENILEILLELPEYRYAKENVLVGPQILLGSPGKQAGKIFVDMTGGTEGPKEIIDQLSKTKIRTLVCMHLSDDHLNKAKDNHLNVVIAGHISSDVLGLNLLLDKIEKDSGTQFECIECSGFHRFRHA